MVAMRVPPRPHTLEALFGVDAATLAAFRVALGLSAVATTLTVALDAPVAAPIAVIVVALGLALITGYRTRLAAAGVWLALIAVSLLAPAAADASLDLVLSLAFWSMFVPLGRRWSADRALAPNTTALPRAVTSVGTAGLLLSAALYWATAWPAVLENRFAGTVVTSAAGWSTVVWIVPAAVLILFSPLATATVRLVVGGALVLVHLIALGFVAAPGLLIAPIAAVIPFLPRVAWERSQRLRTAGAGVTIFYDGGCSFCLQLVRLLRTYLVLPQVRVRPAQSDPAALERMLAENTWVLRDADGHDRTRADGVRALLRHSPVLGWLRFAWDLPGFAVAADRAYRWVAANRPAASQVVRVLPSRPLPVRDPLLVTLVAGLALVLLVAGRVAAAVGGTLPIESLTRVVGIG
jgi:predicted DCC family thiol-disulfide oxidoreductase YuxK